MPSLDPVRRRRGVMRLVVGGTALAASSFAPTLHAQTPPTKAACVAAYEQAQQLRMSGKLRDARTQILVCANAACPAMLQRDCTTWLAEVDGSIPTLLVRAVDESGNETLAVKLSVDGVVVASRLDGSDVPVDPGEHTVRFEHDGIVVEKKVVALKGEKNKRVDVTFAKTAAPPPTSSAPTAPPIAPPPPPTEPAPETRSNTLAYVVGGVGLAGLAVGAVTGLMTIRAKSTIDRECQDHVCSAAGKSAADDGKTYGLVSTIGFGVGVAGVAGAAILLLTKPSDAPRTALRFTPDVAVSPGGASLRIGGAF